MKIPFTSILATSGFLTKTPSTTTILAKNHPYSSSSRLLAIVDEVTSEMKTAMKEKDTTRLATIRLIRSAFANAAIEYKVPALNDEQAMMVLKKMAKMRQESIKMFRDGGANDRADAEQAELEIIERWLPALASEEQTRAWVKEAIQQVGADNVGKVMGALMKAHKAELDGNLAQRIVKEEIQKAG